MRNTISYIHYTLILFLALSFITCETTLIPSDSSGEIDYIQGTTKGTVILKILDAHLSTPLFNALIYIAGGDSALSDSSGTVTFDSVKVGTYIVYGSRSGYESIVTGLDITIDQNSNTVPIVKQSADMLFMAQKGVTLNGSVYYENETIKKLANSAIVECRLTSNAISFLEPVRSTVTLNGSYSFGDLPAYATYTISVLPFSDGEFIYKQAGVVTLNGQAAGDTLPVHGIVLQKVPSENYVVLSHNLAELKVGDSIKITFSESVDISEINADSITVTVGATQKLLVHTIWQLNYTTLCITPFDGQWSIAESYRLVLGKLKSLDGKTLDNTDFTPFTFTPILSGTLGNVQNLRYQIGLNDTNKANFNTTSHYLFWSHLANAKSYELYKKATADSSWRWIYTVSDSMKLVSPAGPFSDGQQVKYLVLGKNSTSLSPLATATILTVRDERPPYIFRQTSIFGFNNSLNLTPDTMSIVISSIYLSEPLDTLTSPSVISIEASDPLNGDLNYKIPASNCTWTWSSNRSGILDVIIDASKNGAYDTLKVDFRKVTDKAGNPADTSNNGGFYIISTL